MVYRHLIFLGHQSVSALSQFWNEQTHVRSGKVDALAANFRSNHAICLASAVHVYDLIDRFTFGGALHPWCLARRSGVMMLT